MRIIDLNDFCHINADFRDLEIFPESWTKRHSFAQYEETPRPRSALFLVCTDIRACFYPRDGKAVSAARGDLVWIPAGVRYSVTVDGGTENRIDTYTLNFSLLDGDGEEILLSDRITVIARERNRLFETRIRTLNSEVHRIGKRQQGEGRNFLRIKSEFFSLLDAIASDDAAGADTYYPIRTGVEALRNEWNRNRRIEEYADMCGISATYFYRCFRQWSGKSPVEYRNMIRLSNAETMLRYTDMKISEISETVGFEDAFYFCRIFTKYFGVSPKTYRAGK
ncbi:MAG: helix-turn-helix transcriptional regulator [Clostridia bacterium]|nr:helix-turn-helix transcriptional regulator [Clostridia bacterium]